MNQSGLSPPDVRDILKTINITLTETGVIRLLEGALIFNTAVLSFTAIRETRKRDKIIKQWQKNHYYMAKINQGLNDIACNPAADPVANREAVAKLIDDINAEILLDQVDFSGIEEHITLKEDE